MRSLGYTWRERNCVRGRFLRELANLECLRFNFWGLRVGDSGIFGDFVEYVLFF